MSGITDLKELGERIRYAIENSTYKPKEVALAIGVSPQAVSKAIRTSQMGKPNLRKMADFLGVNQNWLISGKPEDSTEFNPDLFVACMEAVRKIVTNNPIFVGFTDEKITRTAYTLYEQNLK